MTITTPSSRFFVWLKMEEVSSMESDCDSSNSGKQRIREVKKLNTTIKLEGLSWKTLKDPFGLTWKIRIWMR